MARFGEVLNPARGRTANCVYNGSLLRFETGDGGWFVDFRPCPTPFRAVPARIALPHGILSTFQREEGVAGSQTGLLVLCCRPDRFVPENRGTS